MPRVDPPRQEAASGWLVGPMRRDSPRRLPEMAVIEDVRPLGAELERSYEVYVRGSLRFRVGG